MIIKQLLNVMTFSQLEKKLDKVNDEIRQKKIEMHSLEYQRKLIIEAKQKALKRKYKN